MRLLCQQMSNLVKALVFPVVMYGCESWTIKKAECQRHYFADKGPSSQSCGYKESLAVKN